MKPQKPTRCQIAQPIADYLEEQNIPFKCKYSQNSEICETTIPGQINIKYEYRKKRIDIKALNFIKQVKRYANSRPALAKDYTPFDSVYVDHFLTNPGAEREYYNLVELDINKAYWNVALKLGFISPELYEQGLNKFIEDCDHPGQCDCIQKNKLCRLVALGGLASRTIEYDYDGQIRSKPRDLTNYKTRSMYFKVCSVLSGYMQQAVQEIGQEHFFLFWVDALIMDEKVKTQVYDFFTSKGLDLKEKKISYAYQGSANEVSKAKDGRIFSTQPYNFLYCEEETGRKKTFILPDKTQKKPYISDKFLKAIEKINSL